MAVYFKATLVGVRDNAMLIQPKTRVPVPIQTVPRTRRRPADWKKTKPGIGAGKAIAIGAATGVGAFFGILARDV